MNFLNRLARQYKFLRNKRKAARRPIVVDAPYTICNIELTNHCPMKCVMCPRTQHMTRDLGYMDFDVFKAVIDQAILDNPEHIAGKWEIALHHFGESLQHRSAAKFIRYATEKGVAVNLSVNPIVFTERVIRDLIEAPPNTLYISLDGHDDESFSKIRGLENAYERSKRNLLSYLDAKIANGVRTRIVLNMIDFSLNEQSIRLATSYWKTVAGIDEVAIKGFASWNGDADDVNALQGGRKNVVSDPTQKFFVSCDRPWRFLAITWDGDVVPCCYDYDKKNVLRNVKNQSLKEIWNGEEMQLLRRQFTSNCVTSALCVKCEELVSIL